MDTQNQAVNNIIAFIEGKIEMIKEKLEKFETPIMQEMTKNSPHLQHEYTRLSVELQVNEEHLLVIQKFNPTVSKAKVPKPTKTVKKHEQKK